MQHSQFSDVVNQTANRALNLLLEKNEGYSAYGDALHNFTLAAHIQGVTKRQACAGMMAKHTASIYDLAADPSLADQAVWDEKITDHINYLLFLSAIVAEERSNQETV